MGWRDRAEPVNSGGGGGGSGSGGWRSRAVAPPSEPAEDNEHDLIPFLSRAASGIAEGVGKVASGTIEAIAHPVDTAGKVGDWIEDVATDPMGDIKGAYRAVRSVPLLGAATDDAVSGLVANTKRLGADFDRLRGKGGPSGLDVYDQARKDWGEGIKADDARHADESPVADTAQRLLGVANPLGMSPGANVMDTYIRSRQEGNSATDALKDARNAAVLLKGPGLVMKGAGKVIKKIPAAVTGVPDEMAEYYMKNVDAVDTARPIKAVSDDLTGAVKKFRREMSNQSTEGFNALKNSGLSATATDLVQPIDDQIERIGRNAVTGPAKSSVSELSALKDDISGAAAQSEAVIGATSLDKVKSYIRQIDDLIGDEGYSAIERGNGSSRDKALLAIRRKYDELLKNSPEYRTAMEGLARKASALDEVSGSLRNDKTTDNFLTRMARNKDPRGAEALEALDTEMGSSFGKEVKDSGVQDFFKRENSRGSRNTFVSAAAGALAGGLIGVPPWIAGAIGAQAGPVVDRFGRQAYQSVLRAAAKNPEMIQRYSDFINKAAAAGPASLVAAHKLLQKKDPKYAEATQE